MSEINPFRPAPVAVDARIAELETRLARLQAFVDEIMPALVELARLSDAVEARLPPPQFELPKGWVSIKAASAMCGFKPSTIYAWTRSGKVTSARTGARIAVDPATLPRR